MHCDVFISHASEEKEDLVRPLVQELKKKGVTVWFDEDSIDIGSSINRSISDGLEYSKFAVAILSKNFFVKYWTKNELGALLSLESKNKIIIIPVVHGISFEDLLSYNSLLADKLFLTTEVGIAPLADKIASIIFGKAASTCADNRQKLFFVPELSLYDISCRLCDIDNKGLSKLGELVKKFVSISTSDPEMAILRANNIVRSVLNEVVKLQIQTEENHLKAAEPFDVLNERGILGCIVAKHCAVITAFATLVEKKERDLCVPAFEEVTKNEAELCKQSLKVILNWYINSYSSCYKSEPLLLVGYNDFCDEDIEELFRLEKKLFTPDLISPVEIAKQWYYHNPMTLIGARDRATGKLIGFFNALPVCEELFSKIESGEYVDTHIPIDEIRLYDLPDLYKLYLCSFCVDPEYKNTDAFRLIIDGFIDLLMHLAAKEIYITEIIADAITKKGEELCRFAGMKEVAKTQHSSKIFKAVLLPPSLRIMYKNAQKLFDYYGRVYADYRELF